MTVIEVDIGYATAIFAIADDMSVDWRGVRTFAQAPQHSRGGLMLPLEENCWILTLGGRHAAAKFADVSFSVNVSFALDSRHCADGPTVPGCASCGHDAKAIAAK